MEKRTRKIEFTVSTSEKKYEFKFYNDGSMEAYRAGQPWPAATKEWNGSKAIFTLALDLSIARMAQEILLELEESEMNATPRLLQLLARYHDKMEEWFAGNWRERLRRDLT